ncbi:hypothetical protein SGFS_058950 [Streptomyces graminofaciens]|uniref:Secreted protein n=1 Tax=Streptomyces graminofaciens TaxID=68212 RepID=A0ABN5VMH2_9ACTN|nr:hypothetical protein [Streptomyces graminofaciens]BBC34601.1 hypothetical protein SGFS_058950 [Streptomyces graminofaciens]
MPSRGGLDPRKLRLAGLTVAVAVAFALPLVASAGPIGRGSGTTEAARTAERAGGADVAARSDGADGVLGAVGADGAHGSDAADVADAGDGPHSRAAAHPRDAVDGKADGGRSGSGGLADPSRSPLLLDLGLATAARCGPELTSPDGIEAQTCVLSQGEDTWARTYYRNATGRELSSVLSVMAPGGHTVRMHCAVGAQDEPGACETPRERTRGEMGAYTAVAEFAAPDGRGPLLLRSGSNSAQP